MKILLDSNSIPFIYDNIETIDFDYYSDEMKYLIKPYFLGNIFHCATIENFNSILNNNYIDYTKIHKGSYGFKQQSVCLCDYRHLDRRKKFYKDISGYIYRGVVFLLKEEEYKNVIPPKTEKEYNKTKNEGHLIPNFECWYKGKLSLNKIKKIYRINVINKPKEFNISQKISTYLEK